MESNHKKKKKNHPHLNLPRFYNAQVRKWLDGMTSSEAETFSKHNFVNAGSLLKVEINRWLMNDLVTRWDTVNRVFRFETINLCPTIEEYSRFLGVHYDTDSIVMPPLNQSFKMRMSKDLRIKKEILGPRIETNECRWIFSPIYLPTQRPIKKINTVSRPPGKMEPKSDTRFWTSHSWICLVP